MASGASFCESMDTSRTAVLAALIVLLGIDLDNIPDGSGRSVLPHMRMLACHGKNGPDKNGPAGPILDEKMVRPDQYWLTMYGPAGPILVTKSGPA